MWQSIAFYKTNIGTDIDNVFVNFVHVLIYYMLVQCLTKKNRNERELNCVVAKNVNVSDAWVNKI